MMGKFSRERIGGLDLQEGGARPAGQSGASRHAAAAGRTDALGSCSPASPLWSSPVCLGRRDPGAGQGGGRGILIDRAGLSEIVASDSGQIAAVNVAAGDRVVEGQPIALLSYSSSNATSPTPAPAGPGAGQAGPARGLYAGQTRHEGRRYRTARRHRPHPTELDRRRLALEERVRRIAALVPRGFSAATRIAAEAEAAETRERIASRQ